MKSVFPWTKSFYSTLIFFHRHAEITGWEKLIRGFQVETKLAGFDCVMLKTKNRNKKKKEKEQQTF